MSSEAYLGGDSERDPLENVPAECYDALRHPRRLRVLAVLGRRRTRVSLTELTTAIVDGEGRDVSDGKARHEVRVSLVHNHLPRLADYDLVAFDTDTGAELVDEPPVHPADLSALLSLCEHEDGREMLETLVDPVRMRVVSVLSEHEAISVDRLASKLAGRDGVPEDPERTKLSLHHSHLPRLADAGLLAFDPEAGLVARRERAPSITQ